MKTHHAQHQVLKFPLSPTPKNMLRSVLFGVAGILLLGLTAIPLSFLHIPSEVRLSCILCLTNAFLGYVFIELAFRMEARSSILLLLAGMTLRFFLLLSAIAFYLVTTPAGIATFISSFMVFYLISLFAEVYYINRKTDLLRTAKVPVRK